MLAIPRSLSQLTTSFIGSQCQGILPTLFALYHLNYVLLSLFAQFVVKNLPDLI